MTTDRRTDRQTEGQVQVMSCAFAAKNTIVKKNLEENLDICKEVKILSWKVCGSDGKTYSSVCELENYACRKYWDIQMVSQASWGKIRL